MSSWLHRKFLHAASPRRTWNQSGRQEPLVAASSTLCTGTPKDAATAAALSQRLTTSPVKPSTWLTSILGPYRARTKLQIEQGALCLAFNQSTPLHLEQADAAWPRLGPHSRAPGVVLRKRGPLRTGEAAVSALRRPCDHILHRRARGLMVLQKRVSLSGDAPVQVG